MDKTTFTRMMVAALVVVILVAAALANACGMRRDRDALHFVWLHGGTAPVSGVEATLADADGRVLQTIPLTDGRVPLDRAAASVRIVDRAHDDVVLLDGPIGRTTPIRVPEAIRLRGRVETVRPDTRVRIGSGSRLPPAERYALEHGKQWMRHRGDAQAFGITMPLSASHWEAARLAGNRFESPWIAAAGAPQIVAVDGLGRTGLADVPLAPDMTTGATIDAGTIALTPTRSLEVTAELPSGELPRALVVHLSDVAIDDGRQREAARWLSVLDQIDPQLFEHAVLRASMFLPHAGRLRFTGLPPFAGLTVALLDTDRGTRATRAVRLAGDTTVVSFTAADIVPPRGARGTVRGLVRGSLGAPVPSARVVLADVPERFETTTDTAGAFTFPAVLVDRHVTIFVEAPSSVSTAASHVFRAVDPSKPVTLDMPGTTAPLTGPQLPQQACNDYATTNEQYPSIAGQFNAAWAPIVIRQANWFTKTFEIAVDTSGYWDFYYYEAAFEGYVRRQVLMAANQAQTITVNQPLNDIIPQARLRFYRPGGIFAAQHVTITFPSLLPDPDPIEITTDNDGDIYLNCVNANPIAAFVRATGSNLCYDGDLALQGIFTSVTLRQCQ